MQRSMTRHPAAVLANLALAGVAALLPATLPAQSKFVWSPAGAELKGGGSANAIPFWHKSATYQQIHDHADMLRAGAGNSILMLGLGLRVPGTNKTAARSIEMQLDVGITTVTSKNISTTFATNLGTKPTRVFGGTQTPFTKLSIPAITGTGDPNPPGFMVPFGTSFVWTSQPGNNFCWEMRFKNSTSASTLFASLDSVDGRNPHLIRRPNVGLGCSVPGYAQPATVLVTFPRRVSGPFMHFSPVNVTASTRTLLLAGFTRQRTLFPGWCAALELHPLLLLYGNTGTTGRWDLAWPLTAFKGLPTIELLLQFAFVDSRLNGGVGLTDMAAVQTPLPGAWEISRAFFPASPSTLNGNETATAGTISKDSGLVTAFRVK
jgi:hypothetical protein